MPTPSISKVIAITCANAHEGATVRAYNYTTGETTTGKVASGRAIIDCANFVSGYTAGDVILLKINGAYFGSTTVTLTAGSATAQSATLSLTQTTTTNGPAISF